MLRDRRQRSVRAGSRAETGASAVEFALAAPFLIFGLLATVDLGLALYERMTVDHILRAGAESAMADQGEEKILDILESTAAKNFSVATGTESVPIDSQSVSSGTEPTGDTVALSVNRYCACPEDPGTAVACSTSCAGAKPTFVSYRLAAAKTYQGMILPSMTFSPVVDVQVR